MKENMKKILRKKKKDNEIKKKKAECKEKWIKRTRRKDNVRRIDKEVIFN